MIFLCFLPTLFFLADFFSLDSAVLQEGLQLLCQSAAPTLAICFLSSTLAVFFGFCAAFFLVKRFVPYRFFFFTLVIAALAVPIHIHACHWMILLGRNGLLTGWIQILFPGFSLYGIFGVAWITAVSFSPLATTVCTFSLVYSDKNALAEQVKLYLTPRQRFFWVILPQRLWGIAISFLLVFLLTLGEMAVSDLLGVETLGRQIYLFLSLYYRPEMALMMAIPILAITILVCSIFYFFLKRKGADILESIQKRDNFTCLSYKKKILYIFPLLLCMPYLVSFPVLILAMGNLQNLYNTFFSIAPEFWHSLILSLCSAVLIVLLAMPVAWLLLRNFFPASFFLFFMVWVAVVPSSLTALGILRIFTRAGEIPFLGAFFLALRDTDIILIFGLVIRYIPYVLLVCLLGMCQVPIQLEEQASLFGCNRKKQFFYIVIPLCKTVIMIAFFMGFLLCLFDLNLTLLLVPPGITTLTVRIFTLLHYGVRSDVANSSMFLILIAFFTIFPCYFAISSKKS